MTRKLPIGLALLLAAVLVSQSLSAAQARQAQRNVRAVGGSSADIGVKKVDALTWKMKTQEMRRSQGSHRTHRPITITIR
jgi:hypothetical protein